MNHRSSRRAAFSRSGLILLAAALLSAWGAGCSGKPAAPAREPEVTAAAGATSAVARVPAAEARRIPDAYAFLGWHDKKGYRSGDIHPDSLPRVAITCADPNVYPTYPQQFGKYYHVYDWGTYDHSRLTAESEACARPAPALNSRGERRCVRPDVIDYTVISDTYLDGCGNLYRGVWEVSFLGRDDTLGTLLSKGRTVYPDPKARAEGEVIVGATYPVPAREFLFFTPPFTDDAELIRNLRRSALESTHRYDERTRLFVPR